MWPLILVLAVLAGQKARTPNADDTVYMAGANARSTSPTVDLVRAVAQSGRCADIGDKPEARAVERREIAPGPPPLLSFRYYEGKLHHRYGNAELMLDDAGH